MRDESRDSGTGCTNLALLRLPCALSAAALIGGACGPVGAPADGDGSKAVMQAVVTDIVPTSEWCNRGTGPMHCVSVEPIMDRLPHPPGTPPRFEVDGVRGELEYANAYMIDGGYVSSLTRATGDIYVQPAEEKMVTTAGRSLHVYLQDIPMPTLHDVPSLYRVSSSNLIAIAIDHDRFEGTTPTVGIEDRLYLIDMVDGLLNGAFRALPSYPYIEEVPEPFQVALGGCTMDPSTTHLRRCNAEFRISLPASAMRKPAPNLDAGVGFAVAGIDSGYRGGFPEQMSDGGLLFRLIDRTNYQTLLFTRPEGWPIRIMSWNVRRSSLSKLVGPFDVVKNAAIGKYLVGPDGAENDVIAIQEGWNLEMMAEVVSAAQNERALRGLEPLYVYGPVDFNRSTFRDVVNKIASVFVGDEGTTGGLWILSAMKKAKEGFQEFSACKGEDCFKAKGVQHVRLRLSEPGPTTDGALCRNVAIDSHKHRGCSLPFSGGHTVDIFNIHTNAGGTVVCDEIFEDVKASMLGAAGALMANPQLAAAAYDLYQLIEADLNCHIGDGTIRDEQFAEVNEFITAQMDDQRDRPVIIMGDLNVDGRTLNYKDEDNDYVRMLRNLHIGPSSASSQVPVSDIITPWPDDYAGDVDHGDIAREQVGIKDWSQGLGAGTSLGDEYHPDLELPGEKFCGGYDGKARLDFILVRPAFPPDSPSFVKPNWRIVKIDPGEIWTSPWPGDPGYFGDPPKMLSDHKPVVSHIEVVPLRRPPRYHADWKHDARFRVTSANATGSSDCKGCGDVDMFTIHTGKKRDGGGWKMVLNDAHGQTCDNKQVVSWPHHSCMDNWVFETQHVPSTGHWGNSFLVELYDADSSSGDDGLATVWAWWPPPSIFDPAWNGYWVDWGQQVMLWSEARLELKRLSNGNLLFFDPVNDMDPIPQCTGDHPMTMCFQFEATELPPGNQ